MHFFCLVYVCAGVSYAFEHFWYCYGHFTTQIVRTPTQFSILRLGWYGENCTIMCLHGPDKSIIYAFLPFLFICWCLLCIWTLLVLLWTLYNTNLAESQRVLSESHPSLNSETRVVRRKPPKNIVSQKITFRVIQKHRQMPWSLQNTAKLFFRGGLAWLFEIKFGE